LKMFRGSWERRERKMKNLRPCKVQGGFMQKGMVDSEPENGVLTHNRLPRRDQKNNGKGGGKRRDKTMGRSMK